MAAFKLIFSSEFYMNFFWTQRSFTSSSPKTT